MPFRELFGAQIESKSISVIFVFSDFSLVFPLFFRLGGFYVRLMSALFSVRFLHRFSVDFWDDFGVILGDFWGSTSVILGIDFWMNFACRSKSGPRAAKSGPGAPKSRPRAAQERPRAPKSGPRAAQERPKSGLRAANSSPRAAKSGRRAAQECPKNG